MSMHPTNAYNMAHWKPLPEHSLNIFQIEWKSKTLCRLYFNGDVTNTLFMRTFKESRRNMYETLGAMERRVDNVVFRSLFAESIFAARKMVSGGRIAVNGKPVRLPDTRLQDGDMLQVLPRFWHEVYRVHDNPWSRIWAFNPAYLEVSYSAMATVFLRTPKIEEIPSPYPIQVIDNMAAYYSKKGIRHPKGGR